MNYQNYGRLIVEVHEVKKVASAIFMLGFLVGIIYVNVFARNYVVSMGVFSDYFLNQYSVKTIETKEYMFYIMKLRLFPFLLLAIGSSTKYKRMSAAIFVLWTGFSGGVIFAASVLKLGFKGVGLCIIGMLPHFICYIASYTVILLYLFAYPNLRWNSTKSMSVIIFILLGIISECYINPVILEMFINLL